MKQKYCYKSAAVVIFMVVNLLFANGSFAAVFEECVKSEESLMCKSNNFNYIYTLSQKTLENESILTANIENCNIYNHPTGLANLYKCRDFIVNVKGNAVSARPVYKQFFTIFHFSYADSLGVQARIPIQNVYSLFTGRNDKKEFIENWGFKDKNFKFEKNKIRVVRPKNNEHAKMVFKPELPNSFSANIKLTSTNNNNSPESVFVTRFQVQSATPITWMLASSQKAS